MQATVSSVESSTVSIKTATHKFRIWWNAAGYWQTDVYAPACKRMRGLAGAKACWLYFGSAPSLIKAMTNVAITL
jgi:hypothetical protein